jgi:hypothetical protein
LFAATLAAIRIHFGQNGRFSYPYSHPLRQLTPCPRPDAPAATIAAPLVRCPDLAMFDGHPLALTGWLEAEQAELTVLHRSEEGAVTATAYRFCAPRHALEPTGQHAPVPAA